MSTRGLYKIQGILIYDGCDSYAEGAAESFRHALDIARAINRDENQYITFDDFRLASL